MNSPETKIKIHNFGSIFLDGGARFGSVPKEIWSKKITPDEKNRIKLATNSLLITSEDKVILIDTGCGNKWNDKAREIYKPEYLPLPEADSVTDIILTHLHFDHAGGISYYNKKDLKLTYPKARIYLQKENYTNACKPNLKERASYLKENIEILDNANLNLLEGTAEIVPGVFVHRLDGHTCGQQYVEIRLLEKTIFFPQ